MHFVLQRLVALLKISRLANVQALESCHGCLGAFRSDQGKFVLPHRHSQRLRSPGQGASLKEDPAGVRAHPHASGSAAASRPHPATPPIQCQQTEALLINRCRNGPAADLFRKTDAAGGPANRYPARRDGVSGDAGKDATPRWSKPQGGEAASRFPAMLMAHAPSALPPFSAAMDQVAAPGVDMCVKTGE